MAVQEKREGESEIKAQETDGEPRQLGINRRLCS